MSLDRLDRNDIIPAEVGYSAIRNFPSGIRTRSFKQGQDIHYEGDNAAHLTLLVSGRAFIYSDTGEGLRRGIGLFRPLSLMGEELKRDGKYAHPTNAEALEPTTVLTVERDLLPEVFGVYTDLARDIFQGINADTAYLVKRIKTLGKPRAIHRIADAFMDITQDGEDPVVKSPFTQERIGDIAHVTRATTNQIIGAWREARIIDANGRDLLVTPLGVESLKLIGEGVDPEDAVDQASQSKGGAITPVPRVTERWREILTATS